MSASPSVGPGDQVFLVDGSSFVFRAYFQSMNQDRKYNTRPGDGLPTGAVRLFTTKLIQFIRDGACGIRPTHLAIVFDKTEQSFRKEIFADYKAHRPDPPSDLVPQFKLMRDAVRALGLIPIEQDRYEADDIIATYACQASAAGAEVLIVSSDKDLMQVVRPGVTFYDFESGIPGKPGYRPERRLDREGVIEKFGVPPEQVPDVQALIGDPTDNVPGVPGIGIKTAAQLICEYGSLENLLDRVGEIRQPKRREALIENAEKARISKRLVTLDCSTPVSVPIGATRLGELDAKRLLAFTKALHFSTITKRIAELYDVDPAQVDPDPDLSRPWDPTSGRWFHESEGDVPSLQGEADQGEGASSADGPPALVSAPSLPGRGGAAAPNGLMTPEALVAARRAEAAASPCDRTKFLTLRTAEELDRWIAAAGETGLLAIDVETSTPDPMRSEIVGISLGLEPGMSAYLPLRHRAGGQDGGESLFENGLVAGQIPFDDALFRLKPLLEDPAVLKIGQNVKHDWLVLKRHGIEMRSLDDTMLLSYALDVGKPNLSGHSLEQLARVYLQHSCFSLEDLTGKGKKAVAFEAIDPDQAREYAAEGPDLALRLWRVLKPRLAPERKTTVYETLERPMIATLARMEERGIRIDRNILSRMSGDFAQTIARVEDEVYDIAGERFTIGSPKQLADILFGKFGLPGARKTATGQWSTGARLLEDLAETSDHPLPRKILEWRQLTKLKSYTDALPTYVNPETGRVHTSYALAATTTGRLSSADPNLQNIPIRTEEGRKIRTAFVPEPGHKLISADYSQIELRLLADIADIPQLKKAFADGIDIHATTASEMFGVPVEGMPPEVRRRAKAINFGIVYGISAFGLANQLGIPREEAGQYIRTYFERFPGIRDYMDKTKRAVREQGYVTTLFGRACHYPDISAGNASIRAAVERQAINAPIQGSAADIIRRAMIRMDAALRDAKLSAKMLLQVHDELVFEVPEEEVDATLPVVTRIMEEAPLPAVQLKVPLAVEARAGSNWDAAH
ncbi:DNA polymerase I [Enterovirga aerilata]|uniref:DNA polymerase I n=1 Tax=Enterovirga aerilata TaxID=2730920 RepID=A0A849IB52_9HYPH|nr:DNA polymerase I [Enterovirga sp. DB1703]NNM74521.1 DNA polymerase I [Enterovirga sp. DB1703]